MVRLNRSLRKITATKSPNLKGGFYGRKTLPQLKEYYRSIFGRKAAKISLDGGFTCPNRMAPAAQGAVCSAVPAAVGILRKMPRFPSQSRLQKARRRRQANGKTLPISPISKPSRIPMPPRRSCGRNTRKPSPAPKSKAFPLPPEPIACPRMSLPFWRS